MRELTIFLSACFIGSLCLMIWRLSEYADYAAAAARV